MKLFVYNTLLNHPTLSHVLRRLPRTAKAKLPNALEHRYHNYPTIGYAEGHTVYGEVFEISDVELKKLDKWEDHYRRIPVLLSDGTIAQAYILDKNKFV